MSSLAVALIAFVCIFGGAFIGMALRYLLPQHHLSNESKDAVKLGTGMIATLAALVLGLLTASAKGTFDMMTTELRQMSSKIMLLDTALAQYGPGTREARDLLRSSVSSSLQRIWPEDKNIVDVRNAGSGDAIEGLQDKIEKLSPNNDTQKWHQSRALQLTVDIAEARALLVQQTARTTSLPIIFFVVLVFWLTTIFVSFGMFSTTNATVIIAFLICALSLAGSIFLIVELDQPYKGVIKISSGPLRHALAHIGK